ncbi:MAG: cell surface protein SprA, partial [Candidatus Zixiibacteriota bacterium]
MRGLPQGSWNQSRAEFIELRMAIRATAGNESSLGKLHIDLGQITEDVNGNGVLDTEDREVNGIRNGILDEGEDTGLDLLADTSEVGYDPDTNPDPNGDNWEYDKDREFDVSRINGTEGNSQEYLGGGPDSEDLGGATEFDRVNSYYSFEIDLANPDPAILVEGSEYTQNGFTWKNYRIPLWDPAFYEAFGTPDSTSIQFYRLWVDRATDSQQVYIAAVDIVENRWKGELSPAVELDTDTTGTDGDSLAASVHSPTLISADIFRTEEPGFLVAVKNTETDVNSYEPPPGVSGYKDPTTNVREKEQSISLEYSHFIPGDTGRAVYSNPAAQDFTGYRNLRMFVHGADDADGKTLFYFRFGQSKERFYEYRDTVFAGWDANNVEIDFNFLTNFKEESRRVFQERGITALDTFDVDSKLGVKGNPSLATVSYMEMGLIRLGDPGDPEATGEVWCDELRLTEVRKDPGTAARVSMTAGFADLMGFTATVHAQDYAFRSLTSGRTGSVINSSSQLNTDVRANISLDKFLPLEAGLTLPVGVTYQKRVATPKLLTGSDVILSDSLAKEEETTSLVTGISIGTVRWKPPIDHWLLNSTIGSLAGQFTASRKESSSPTVPGDTSTVYTGNASYNLTFQERLTFPALFWSRFLLFPRRVYGTQFSLLPTDFQATGNFSRTETININRTGLRTETYNRQFTGAAKLGLKPIPAISVGYSMNTQRDLSNPEELKLVFNYRDFKLGKELQFSQRLTADYRPTLFSFFSPSFGYSADFADRIDNIYGDHDVDVTRRWSVTGTFDPRKFWDFASMGRPGAGRKKSSSDIPRGRDRAKPVEPEDQPPAPSDSAAGPDEAAKKPDEEDSGPGISPLSAWRGLMRGFNLLTSPIDPLSVTFSRQNADSRNGLMYRPPYAYQFGLNLYHDTVFSLAPESGNSAARTDAYSETDVLNVKNNFRIGRFLTIASSFGQSVARREQRGYLPNETRSRTFPSLNTQLGQLEKFKPVGWILVNASVKTGYTRKDDESYVGDSLTSEATNEGWTPVFSITGQTKQGIRLTLSNDRTTNITRPSQANATKRVTAATRLTLDYSFRSPNGIPIPFLRSIRLSSQLTMSLSVLRRTTTTEIAPKGTDDFAPSQESKELSFEPRMNYSFSSRVKGGMTARWTDSEDTSAGSPRKTHIRELGLWAEFSF